MIKLLSTLLFITGNLFTLNAQDKPVPKELKPFIKEGYEAMDFEKGDLNGDKLEDYLLILKIKGEDTMTYDNPEWDAQRPLLLLIRQTDKKLKEAITNDELILCRNCGGVMGDPYQGIMIKPGGFSVDFYGGSSWRWSDTYTFLYDKVKKDWFLERHGSSNFHAGDPEGTEENTTIRRSEIGDVSLLKYSPDYNTDSSEWKVNVAKTYFYQSPLLGSKPKKAYLVKGNTVTSYKQFKNFIQCTFTNNKDESTTGFILKKDLVLVGKARN